MPPSQARGFLAARLSSPTLNATNTARLIVDASKQAQDGVRGAAASAISSSTSGFAMPPSQFVGVGASGAGKGVVIGVASSIVAIFLVVMVIALTVHVNAGRGRYNQTNMNQRLRGTDAIQLRNGCWPQQGGRQNAMPVSMNQGQTAPSTTAAGGRLARDSPRTGSWKSSLDGKLARCIEAVRNWRK